jgi:hypothetical protein
MVSRSPWCRQLKCTSLRVRLMDLRSLYCWVAVQQICGYPTPQDFLQGNKLHAAF